jgi:hypothetical protein
VDAVDALAANFSSVAPFLKGGVVEFASLVELVLEELNLGLVRVETVWVAEPKRISRVYKEHSSRQTKREDARIGKRRPHSAVRLMATVPCG